MASHAAESMVKAQHPNHKGYTLVVLSQKDVFEGEKAPLWGDAGTDCIESIVEDALWVRTIGPEWQRSKLSPLACP